VYLGSVLYRNRLKLAAAFYFVGFIQLIYYSAARLLPSLVYLEVMVRDPGGFIQWLWSVVMELCIGMLFISVAWLLTVLPGEVPNCKNSAKSIHN
jgi:hypothetical protein